MDERLVPLSRHTVSVRRSFHPGSPPEPLQSQVPGGTPEDYTRPSTRRLGPVTRTTPRSDPPTRGGGSRSRRDKDSLCTEPETQFTTHMLFHLCGRDPGPRCDLSTPKPYPTTSPWRSRDPLFPLSGVHTGPPSRSRGRHDDQVRVSVVSGTMEVYDLRSLTRTVVVPRDTSVLCLGVPRSHRRRSSPLRRTCTHWNSRVHDTRVCSPSTGCPTTGGRRGGRVDQVCGRDEVDHGVGTLVTTPDLQNPYSHRRAIRPETESRPSCRLRQQTLVPTGSGTSRQGVPLDRGSRWRTTSVSRTSSYARSVESRSRREHEWGGCPRRRERQEWTWEGL